MINMLTVNVNREKALIIFTSVESRLLGSLVVTLDNSNQKLFPCPQKTQYSNWFSFGMPWRLEKSGFQIGILLLHLLLLQ